MTMPPSSSGSSPRSDHSTTGDAPIGHANRLVALVTGGARRVGLAIARSLAAHGCDLVLTYRTSREQAEHAARELIALGATVRLERIDLGNLDDVVALGESLAVELPRLDVLVHNAAVYEKTPLARLTPETALAFYRVNALAPLLLSERLGGRLAESPLPGGGAIVAMLDIHALGLPRRRFVAYSMSKAALAEMVRSLARDLAPRVRVNGVAPGVVAWPEHGPDADPKSQQKYLDRVPLRRPGTPEDAAEAVRWLALQAAYVTGQFLRLDGGRSLV